MADQAERFGQKSCDCWILFRQPCLTLLPRWATASGHLAQKYLYHNTIVKNQLTNFAETHLTFHNYLRFYLNLLIMYVYVWRGGVIVRTVYSNVRD